MKTLNWDKWWADLKKGTWEPQIICPNLALIFSPESPSLPYYSESLPLKGNGSQACRITVSGNAPDRRSSASIEAEAECDWPHACVRKEEKSVFTHSRKSMESTHQLGSFSKGSGCEILQQCSYKVVSLQEICQSKWQQAAGGVGGSADGTEWHRISDFYNNDCYCLNNEIGWFF